MQFRIEQLEERNLLNGTSLLSDGDFETNPASWGAVFSEFEVSDSLSFEGQSSATSTNRTSSFGGLYSEISGLVREGVLYEISLWIRVVDQDGQPVRLGIEQFDADGYQYVELETRESIEANQWKKLSGTFSFRANGDLESLKIKIDGPTAGVDFLVDDVRLFDPVFRLGTNLVNNSTFETSTVDWFGWEADVALSVSEFYEGRSAALISNRTQAWQGIATDISGMFQDGFSYWVTAKVFVADVDAENLQLGIKQTDDLGETYRSIDFRGAVSGNQWLTLSGEFELTVNGSLELLELYVNGPSASVDFYVDDFQIESKSLIPNSHFESGTEGWFGQAGSNLSVQSNVVKAGDFAAVSTARTSIYSGPARNMLEILEVDQDYELGVWVRIDGTDPQPIRLGLKQVDDRGERFIWIDEREIEANEWVWLEGGFRYSSDGETTLLEMHVFLPEPGTQIYVDEFKAVEKDWRTETDARIDHFRKRDLELQFVDAEGNPVNNVEWRVEQISHDFAFGSAINSDLFSVPEYRRFFLENFNFSTIEYEIQWNVNERYQNSENYFTTDRLVRFLKRNDIPFRAHALFWGEDIRRPEWFESLTDEELFAEMVDRVNSVVGRYAGDVAHWDVNNEMIQNQYFSERLGDNIRKWMFDSARAIDPNATLMTNEYFALSWRNTYEYLELIEELLGDDIPLDAIGLQSHYSADLFQNPTPTGIRHKLDKFDDFDLPIWITEYDSKNSNVIERAKDLDAFYRAVYSHPSIDGTVMWGFWEGNQWNMRGPLLDLDFTVNETGQAYLDLRNEWTTNVQGETGQGSGTTIRGYHGTYRVSAELPDGTQTVQTISLGDQSINGLAIEIPFEDYLANQSPPLDSPSEITGESDNGLTVIRFGEEPGQGNSEQSSSNSVQAPGNAALPRTVPTRFLKWIAARQTKLATEGISDLSLSFLDTEVPEIEVEDSTVLELQDTFRFRSQ